MPARCCASAAAAARTSTANSCKASCWKPRRWPASPATSRPNWWSPPARARRWPSWKPCWPNAASACLRAAALRRRRHRRRHGGRGLSGPARASVGSVRDYVLGLTMINGRGEVLIFGGQVMKNVAGYDVSRLVAGSLGTLGLIAEVSLKVLPVAPAEATLKFEMSQAEALRRLNDWGGQPLPLNASCWVDDAGVQTLFLRLRGAVAAVESACKTLGRRAPGQRPGGGGLGAVPRPAPALVQRARRPRPVAAVGAADRAGARSARAAADRMARRPALGARGAGRRRSGCVKWPCAPAAMPRLFAPGARAAAAGHRRFAPLAAPLDRIHRELKREFDPAGIFNRGRHVRRISDRMQTDLVARIQEHARRSRGRGHPAQVRALRLLHRHLSRPTRSWATSSTVRAGAST